MAELTKEQATLKAKAFLTKRWESTNENIAKLKALDDEKLLLNLQARHILKIYLDLFAVMTRQPLTRSNAQNMVKILDSLDYLIKILLKRGQRKRPLA